MQGSVAIPPSPVIMENTVFRQKLGLSLTKSVLNSGNSNNVCCNTNTARCLFGPPDPKQSKDLVREFELKNAINFGKRFNFDIVNGEPFPSAKKMKMSHNPTTCDDSDEENVNLNKSVKKEEEGEKDEGYIWGETFSQEYMEMCNKHAVNTSMVGPSRHATVSLLFAPIIHSNHLFTSASSKTSAAATAATRHESPKTSTSQSEIPSSNNPSAISTPPSPPSAETNNNVIISNNKSHSNSSAAEKKQNRINSNSHPVPHHHSSSHHHQTPSAKKSSLSTAHQILTKYTNRVVKHAVMKKPRKSIITDYMHVRRMKVSSSSQPNGKKQL